MAVGNVLDSAAKPANGTDTLNTRLSEVQRLVQQNAAQKSPATDDKKPYTEQEWFIRAQVASMQVQIDFYSRMPDSIGGPVIDHLTEQANKLIGKLQSEAKAKQAEMDAKQAELDKVQREKNEAAQRLSVDDMLERAKRRANGEKVDAYVPPALDEGIGGTGTSSSSGGVMSADEMLKRAEEKIKGGTVDRTA